MTSDRKEKNPITRMFGAFLRVERNNLGISSDEMAKKLNLGNSFYRLIESGAALLNPNRIVLLISAFPNSNLDFGRTSKFLAGMHYLDYEIETSTQTLLSLYNELSEKDDDFLKFCKNTSDYFTYEDGSEEQKKFLTTNSSNEIKDFLSNTYYILSKDSQFKSFLQDKLGNLPSLNVQLLMDFMEVLGKHPPLHIGEIAQDWEYENRSKFKSLKGAYLDYKLIISDENLLRFHYDYLFNESFDSIEFIFINATEKPALLKEEFVEILNRQRKKINLSILTDKEATKLKIKVIKYETFKLQINKILESKYSNSILNAFWVFETLDGRRIGFVGAKDDDRNYVINLSSKDCETRENIFDKL